MTCTPKECLLGHWSQSSHQGVLPAQFSQPGLQSWRPEVICSRLAACPVPDETLQIHGESEGPGSGTATGGGAKTDSWVEGLEWRDSCHFLCLKLVSPARPQRDEEGVLNHSRLWLSCQLGFPCKSKAPIPFHLPPCRSGCCHLLSEGPRGSSLQLCCIRSGAGLAPGTVTWVQRAKMGRKVHFRDFQRLCLQAPSSGGNPNVFEGFFCQEY